MNVETRTFIAGFACTLFGGNAIRYGVGDMKIAESITVVGSILIVCGVICVFYGLSKIIKTIL